MENRLFFLCPDNDIPSGGVKQIYRQVDLLNENGFDAYVIHNRENYRASWFKNETKILRNRFIFKTIKYARKQDYSQFRKKYDSLVLKYLKEISFEIRDSDYVIFPEIYAQFISDINIECKKVIFNQNCYYTFLNKKNNYSFDKNYSTKYVEAVIVVSKNSEEYLKLAFQNIRIFRTRLGISSDRFNFSINKKKQIAYMPRKLKNDVEQVINIINLRGNLNDWNFIAIDGEKEELVAKILKESALFLSFNHKEGFGLPPAEAMACGCVVIGYQGEGGKEYFNENFCFPVEDGNIINFVKKIEFIALTHSVSDLLEIGKKASDFILSAYNSDIEKNDIISIWKKIITKTND
jgi:glycosyltransferase involved in cell wall biosynthesis